jgi:hypothetical protein
MTDIKTKGKGKTKKLQLHKESLKDLSSTAQVRGGGGSRTGAAEAPARGANAGHLGAPMVC